MCVCGEKSWSEQDKTRTALKITIFVTATASGMSTHPPTTQNAMLSPSLSLLVSICAGMIRAPYILPCCQTGALLYHLMAVAQVGNGCMSMSLESGNNSRILLWRIDQWTLVVAVHK